MTNACSNVGRLLFALSVALGAMSGALAGPIVSATSATINSGGPGFGSINDTFNQAGLATPYVSGVTDFDTYIATDPQHTSTFSGFEWFSNFGSTSASVTYNLGVSRTIDALALWNEEASGIGVLNLLVSMDGGATFVSLATGLTPTDNPTHPAPYGPDVFAFSAVTTQFIRFDMSACPQQPADFNACAIGEVAFRIAQAPEPGSLVLLGLGLAGLAFARRRRKA